MVLRVYAFHFLQLGSLLAQLNLFSLVCFFIALFSFFANPLGQSFVILFGVIFEVRILSLHFRVCVYLFFII